MGLYVFAIMCFFFQQDLETYDEKKKAQDRGYTWGLSPQHLLRSYPLEKWITMPSTVLRVGSSTLTTAYLLWSKNAFLFFVVFGVLIGKKFILEQAHDIKSHIWWTYLYRGAPHSRRAKIDIFQALRNFYDVRVNGNELYHLKQLHKEDEARQIAKHRREAFHGMYYSVTSIIREAPTIVTYVVGCGLIVRGSLAPSDLVMFPTSIQTVIDDCQELYEKYQDIYDVEVNLRQFVLFSSVLLVFELHHHSFNLLSFCVTVPGSRNEATGRHCRVA